MALVTPPAPVVRVRQPYQRPQLSLRNQIVVGTLSGWTEIMVCQPIDTYKTGLQSAQRVRFAEFFRKGVGHWYAGITPMLGFRAVYISSLKVSNEWYKNTVAARGIDPTTQAQLMASGVVAGIVATPVSCVSEWFKTQMQNNGLRLSTLVHANRTSFRAFAGMSATTLREACYGATLFGLNPIYYRELQDALPTVNSHVVHVISGISAGITGGLVSQPFDTIKTLMQEKYGQNARSGFFLVARERIAARGVASLWAGIVARGSRLAIGTLILDRCMTYYGSSPLLQAAPAAPA
jgi:hypothetical protein